VKKEGHVFNCCEISYLGRITCIMFDWVFLHNVVGEIVLLWILMKYNFLLPNYEKGYTNDAVSFIQKFRCTWSSTVNDSLFRKNQCQVPTSFSKDSQFSEAHRLMAVLFPRKALTLCDIYFSIFAFVELISLQHSAKSGNSFYSIQHFHFIVL